MLRYAPSPTGDMEIENLRIAILNYLVARQRNEPFLVRIDDTDKERNIEGKDTEIMQILEKFALKHDQVYHQSEHLHMHQTLAIRLLEEEKAFLCTCTPDASENSCVSGRCIDMNHQQRAALKQEGTPFVIRMKKPEKSMVFDDIVQGKYTISADKIGTFAILKKDGTPTSEFASACGDMFSNISLVLCEEAYLESTFRQIHIKQMLGYTEETHYAHIPAIVDAQGSPVSLQHEAYSLKWLFSQGFIPDAIVNYLLLLGNHSAKEEIFTLPDAAAWFDLENISKSPVRFESDTLRSINREHLRMMDDKRLSSLFGFADADVGKLAKLYLEEADTINELAARIRPVFAPKPFEGKWEKEMKTLQQVLADAPMFRTFEALKEYVSKETGLKEERFLEPLRLLLTGTEKGPDLNKIYPLIRSYLLEVIS